MTWTEQVLTPTPFSETIIQNFLAGGGTLFSLVGLFSVVGLFSLGEDSAFFPWSEVNLTPPIWTEVTV